MRVTWLTESGDAVVVRPLTDGRYAIEKTLAQLYYRGPRSLRVITIQDSRQDAIDAVNFIFGGAVCEL